MFLKKVLSAVLALLVLVPFFAVGVSAADSVISKGKSYTVEYATPIENAYPKKAYKKEKTLTDGKTATTATLSDKAWLELYRGTSVSVTIDLESVMAVSKVDLQQLQYKDAGAHCSRYVEVYVSENGTDFGFAGRVDDDRSITYSIRRIVPFVVQLDKSYKARYVRVVFSSSTFTYVDEISVYGSSDTSSAATAEITKTEDRGMSGDVDGIKSVCLMYTSALTFTADFLKPYFAYIDSTGKATDTMFDSLLFLSLKDNEGGYKYARQNDMKDFVADAFQPKYNVGALNTVVGDLKDDLGLPADYKYPIFLAVPTIGYYSHAFGEIDGKQISSNSLENRSAITKWYIDYAEGQFKNANYQNIELKGFYWLAESINHSISTHESELVKYFNDYSHSKGYKTMWIPYYSSSGIDEAKDLGFDSVTMQSGYAFKTSANDAELGASKAQVCKDAAENAAKFGLNGIEFEVEGISTNDVQRFTSYVRAAYGAGLIDHGMITMYQVGSVLYNSATGGNATERQVYELTYKYCSGKYTEATPVIKSGKTVTVKAGEYIKDKVEVEDEDTKRTDLKIAEIERPEGININVQGSGVFEVDATGSEPGTYTTRFSVTDGNNVSNTVEVTVIVEPNPNAGNGDDSGTSGTDNSGKDNSGDDNGADDGNEDNNNTLMIILIAVGAVVVIAGAVFAVVKIRSKKK